MTTTQRDAIYQPAKGLIIYAANVDCLEINLGTPSAPIWGRLITGTAWNLTGNAGTNSGTNFLGTTDNVSLRLRTNNTERVVIDSTGKVGIGLTNPSYKLQVMGTKPLSLLGVQVGVESTDSLLTIYNGEVRKIAPQHYVLKGTYSLTLPDINNNTGTNVTLTFPNVPYVSGAPNAVVTVNPTADLPDGLIISWCRVSATNTINISFRNSSNAKIYSQLITFDITVIKN
jgi:hypothetical protein